MSGTETSRADQTGACGQQGRAHAAGLARLLPTVAFGMRAAVLAGVIVAAIPAAANAAPATVTAGLSAPVTTMMSTNTIACCGQNGQN